jgi:hypothetical protein
MKKNRGCRGIAVLILKWGAQWCGWLTPCPHHFAPSPSWERAPGTHCREGWVVPLSVLGGYGDKISCLHQGFNTG